MKFCPRGSASSVLVHAASISHRCVETNFQNAGEEAVKLVRRVKCLSGCRGVPDADMTCLILGGGQRGADVSLPVVEVLLPELVLVPVPVGVALCA